MSSHALDSQMPEKLVETVAKHDAQLREVRTLQLNSANAIQIVGVPDDYMDIDDIAAAGEELTYNFQIFPAGSILTNWDLYFTVYVDLPEPGKSGLHDAVARLEGIEKIASIRFGPGDVVRHPLVGRIVEAYEGPGR